jgi:hypothetical protein
MPAVSALARTLTVSSSIEAAVCCRLLACASVRWLRSALPLAIWTEPVAIESLDWRTWPTTSARRSRMRCMAATMLVVSPVRVRTCTPRLPSAMALAMATTSPGSAPSWRTRPRVITTAISTATAAARPATTTVMVIATWPSARAAWPSLIITLDWYLVRSATAVKNARCDGRIVTRSVWAASSNWPSFTSWATASRSLSNFVRALAITSNSSRVRGSTTALSNVAIASSVACTLCARFLAASALCSGSFCAITVLRMKRAWALALSAMAVMSVTR